MKRFFSLLLVATMLLAVMPLGVTVVEAAEVSQYAPYANIEYGYSDSVTCGTIRYISQSTSDGYFNWNYWPSSAFGGYSHPSTECGTASISMAMSYIGINLTPKAILEANNGVTYFSGWSGTSFLSYSASDISTAVDNYINGEGKYSPPVIHIPGYSSAGHYVVVIGRISSNSYQILDPWERAVSSMTINGSSATYYKSSSTIYDTIDQLYQWKNDNAELPTANYLSNCTKYPCAAIIEVTTACNPCTLPCNSQTAANYGCESIALTEKAFSVGDMFVATALYENSEGNYWYETKFSDGTVGYVFANRTEFYNVEIPWINGGWFYSYITGATPLNGTVATTGTLDYVQAFIYYGTDSHSSVATSSNKVAVNAGTYPLKGSTVDNTLHFEYLSEGYYTLSIEVEFSTYYSKGGELEWTGACARAGSYNFMFDDVNTDTPVNNTYTISYDANGGWGEPAAQTKTEGIDIQLSSQIPSRDGYYFLGWSESSTAAYATYEWGDWFTGDYSVTLYAVWEAINDMTLHASADSVYLTLGESETITISVWSEGYYDGSTEVWWQREDATVSCQWGTYSNGVHPLTITANSAGTTTITLSLRDSDTGEWLDSRLVYVYIDALNYTIKYNANGGYNAPASHTKEHDTTAWISSDIPSRFGYNFVGWSEYSNATYASYQPDEAYYNNSDLTFYAVWEQIPVSTTEYTVEVAQIDYPDYGIYYKFTPTVTTSYKIWGLDTVDNNVTLYDANGNQLAYDDDSYGESYQFELDYVLTQGSTYYIYVRYYSGSTTGDIYFAISRGALISYNANGGSGAPASHYEYCGASPSLSSTIPARDGYNFLGWSTSSYATSATYNAGDSFTTNENTTLYAVWAKKNSTLEPDPEYALGDVNNDGKIDQYDYILVRRHYFETRYLTDDEASRADVNADGVVDQFDYILIARHYFGTYVIG